MDSLKTDDELTIVNRSMEHRVSKELIRKIPYFEKMLSHDLKESKENKVVLDFDELIFELILNWSEFGCIFIEMDYVINLCTLADYLGVNNYLIDDCISHFHDNFAIEHLPVVIPQVTSTSKLINSAALNGFICCHFTKIANTTFWLDYPFETIEYICALDLMIHSKLQVYDAIMKWIEFKADSRNHYQEQLLKLIRWCHGEDELLSKIKENESTKSLSLPCFSDEENCDCDWNRTKQKYFIAIEQFNATDLQIKVFDNHFMPLINKVVQSDESMNLHVLHDEYVSDIVFDSGRQMVRIDWKHDKYRLLDHSTYKSHYLKIHKCLFEDQKIEPSVKVSFGTHSDTFTTVGSLLEASDKFILIRFQDININNYYKESWFKCFKTPTTGDINFHFVDSGPTYLATVLDNNIYVLKENLEFSQINIDSKFQHINKKLEIKRLEDFEYDDLLLTSSQANDDKIIFIVKSIKAIFCYNVITGKWSSMGRISNCDTRSADGQRESGKLITFTSTFLSMDAIKPFKNK